MKKYLVFSFVVCVSNLMFCGEKKGDDIRPLKLSSDRVKKDVQGNNSKDDQKQKACFCIDAGKKPKIVNVLATQTKY